MPNDQFQLIGSGGYGKVYKIQESSSSEKAVAVKIVSGFGGLSEYENAAPRVRERIQSGDASRKSPANHSILCYILDQRNSRIMIVMEYMEGGSLADKLKDQNPLPDNAVLKYLVQILEGVGFIHKRQIYHSDIKPSNILFTAEDNLKISDFGIAVGGQLQTTASATSSHILGYYSLHVS